MNFEQPKSERKESTEVSDVTLIEILSSRNTDDPELHRILTKWTEQEERKINNNPESSIRFNIRRGKLYAEAGYIEEALDALDGARIQSFNEKRTELFNEIDLLINQIINKD